MATPGADRETVGNRGQPFLSGVRGRPMGRATGGLRGTASVPGAAPGMQTEQETEIQKKAA